MTFFGYTFERESEDVSKVDGGRKGKGWREEPSHYFASLADRKIKSAAKELPFCFLSPLSGIVSFAVPPFVRVRDPSRENLPTLRFRLIIISALPTAVRDFLCAGMNTFYGRQKKILNYRARILRRVVRIEYEDSLEGALHDNRNGAAARAVYEYRFPGVMVYINDAGRP